MKRKVSIAVSAMILAVQLGSPAVGQQSASLEQLSTIATLLNSNDVGGLRAYLETNPELLEGDSELAALLRRFLAASAEVTTYLAFEEDLSEVFDRILADSPVEEGSDPGDDPAPPGGGQDPGGEEPGPDPGEDPDGEDSGPDPGEDPDGEDPGPDPGEEPGEPNY
jgi:hypothetical protein